MFVISDWTSEVSPHSRNENKLQAVLETERKKDLSYFSFCP